jgi:MoaA/NifB/PqqE/SkfB family radical SAM enzyme
MTTDQWTTTIRQLADMGTMRLKFQGGEPTLRQDFREICKAAQEVGLITAVTTNGLPILKRPEQLDYIDEIVFSLDGVTAEVNDAIRGSGVYEKVVRAFELARERALQTIVNMTVCRLNLHEVEPMLEFCEARGILVHMMPVICSLHYSDSESDNLALTHDEARQMHLRLAEWKRQGRGLLFSSNAYQKAADWPDASVLTIRSEGYSPCMGGKSYIHIEPNGDVHPCGHHQADFIPKNLLKEGLVEALRHVRRHNCGDCWTPTMNERKALFGLRPTALREMLLRR